ncbi:uncharacterized protein AAES06_018029 isoform 2-T3 [Glossophaga mutica]
MKGTDLPPATPTSRCFFLFSVTDARAVGDCLTQLRFSGDGTWGKFSCTVSSKDTERSAGTAAVLTLRQPQAQGDTLRAPEDRRKPAAALRWRGGRKALPVHREEHWAL